MAHLESVERKLKESEAERRREKLSTWSTVARETERSAGRERFMSFIRVGVRRGIALL